MRSPDQRADSHATSTRAPGRPRAACLRATFVAALALSTGACSVSYPLYDKTDEIKTGSIDQPASDVTPQPAAAVPASSPLPAPPGATQAQVKQLPIAPVAYSATKATTDEPAITPADWAYARGALTLAMGAEAVNASVPWANPDTGSYGAFSASSGTVQENGATCRPFAATHAGGGREQRLEGTACRTAAGHWEAVSIKARTTRIL